MSDRRGPFQVQEDPDAEGKGELIEERHSRECFPHAVEKIVRGKSAGQSDPRPGRVLSILKDVLLAIEESLRKKSHITLRTRGGESSVVPVYMEIREVSKKTP